MTPPERPQDEEREDLSPLPIYAGKRRALLLGVPRTNYRPNSGKFNALPNVQNDLNRMIKLTKGFSTKKKVGATAKQGVDLICEVAKATEPGDLCLIYFSGHGYTIPDPKGGDGDGNDECLVFANDVLKDDWAATYLWPNTVRGARYLVILDACHSLSALGHEAPETVLTAPPDSDRGIEYDGIEIPAVDYVKARVGDGATIPELRDELGLRRLKPAVFPSRIDSPSEYWLLTLAACGDEELTYDDPGWFNINTSGAATTAMADLIKRNKRITHRELWAQVATRVVQQIAQRGGGTPVQRYTGPDDSLVDAVALSSGLPDR